MVIEGRKIYIGRVMRDALPIIRFTQLLSEMFRQILQRITPYQIHVSSLKCFNFTKLIDS